MINVLLFCTNKITSTVSSKHVSLAMIVFIILFLSIITITTSNFINNNNNELKKQQHTTAAGTRSLLEIKPQPSYEELQSVLNSAQHAYNLDVENILLLHYPKVIQFRDDKYLEAERDGIDINSDPQKRVEYIKEVAEYIYSYIKPPNEYTKITDSRHYNDVESLVIEEWKKKHKNDNIPITLQIAAWFHDIERFIPETKCKYLPESVDKYRKQCIHPITSAKVCLSLLKNAPITEREKDIVKELIYHHDMTNPLEDVIVMGESIMKGINIELYDQLKILQDADAITFFEFTLPLFIDFKSKTNSGEWIWERVYANLKRLTPHLQINAIQKINELSDGVIEKIKINTQQLHEIRDNALKVKIVEDNTSVKRPLVREIDGVNKNSVRRN